MHLPVGPISRDEAKRLVEELLCRHLDDEDMEACDKQPLKHWVVEDWVSARRSIPSRQECERDPELHLRRYGRINPAYRQAIESGSTGQLPPLFIPQQGRGRPKEMALDRANAELLAHFPSLADHPFVFALLESLFGLDRKARITFARLDGGLETNQMDEETSRHRGPAGWAENEEHARSNHELVRKRARKRLDRALTFKEWPDKE